MTDRDTTLPPALDRLRVEFTRLAEADAHRPRRRLRVGRSWGVAGVILCIAAAAAGATGIAIKRGEPLPAAPPGDLPRELTPRPGSARLDAIRVADPGGGPPWGIRLSTSETGQRCFAVGRVVNGHLGRVVDGEFRELPLRGPGTCADLTQGPFSFGVDQRPGATPEAGRTIIAGIAGSTVTHFEVRRDGRLDRLVPSRMGAFLAIYGPDLRVEDIDAAAVFSNGTRRQLPLRADTP